MTALDRVLPAPRLLELDAVEVALPPARAWELLRHTDLGRHSRLVRLLFALRTAAGGEETSLALDDLRSSPSRPGFQILVEDEGRELVIGAIGKVWKVDIPFVHVEDADAFVAMSEPDYAKVAWALRCVPLGDRDTRIEIEVRVDATDERAFKRFRRYFRIIGPFSRFIRRTLLSSLAREYGTPESLENERPLAGDALLPDARAQVTHAVVIDATPEAIWPWLVQMGCRRAGFYGLDLLDNGGRPSAREIHPELLDLEVGDVIPTTPSGVNGFEVLAIEPRKSLVLGGLYDEATKCQLPFHARRHARFWHVTWAFELERLDAHRTRLHARGRAAYSDGLHALWARPVHHLMETVQLHNLARRAEGRLPRDSFSDVVEGASGAAVMLAAFATPCLRHARGHWGLDEATAARVYPGDDVIAEPRWSWTHGIEIDAPADAVWPWVVQIGADRAGFYSYQWLENLAGCAVRNAEAIHPEWSKREGLSLHPKMPLLEIHAMEPGRWFVAHAPGKDVEATWLFLVEPLGGGRSRFVSRYRLRCDDRFATRLAYGPALMEPVGFAMDRRMLLGVKARAEGSSYAAQSSRLRT